MFEGATERPRSPQRTQQDPPPHERVDAHRRYSLIAVAGSQFAYSDPGDYLRALGRAWSAGLAPEPLPSVLGEDLPAAAPALAGVDRDSFG